MARAPTAAVLLAASLLTAGCGLFGPNQNDTLAAARARWDERGPASYQLTVQRLCYCGSVEPVRVTVVQGVVAQQTYVESGDPVPDALASYYPAVPGLFDIVADAYRRADDLHVTFDPDYGFPTSIVIDYVKSAIDDELTVRATDFLISPSLQ